MIPNYQTVFHLLEKKNQMFPDLLCLVLPSDQRKQLEIYIIIQYCNTLSIEVFKNLYAPVIYKCM